MATRTSMRKLTNAATSAHIASTNRSASGGARFSGMNVLENSSAMTMATSSAATVPSVIAMLM